MESIEKTKLLDLNNQLFEMACAAMYVIDDISRRNLCLQIIQAIGYVSTDMDRIMAGMKTTNDNYIANTMMKINIMKREDDIL